MRISPIINYQNTQRQIKRRNNPSFGDLIPWIKDNVADKLQYVKDPSRELIYHELKEYYYGGDIDDSMIGEVQTQIYILQRKRKEKDKIIETLDKKIAHQDKKIEQQNSIQKDIHSQIDKIRIKDAIDKIRLSKITASFNRMEKINTQLEDKYINLFKLDEKKFPNAIMISGVQDDKEKNMVLEFLTKKGCKILKTDFARLPLNKAVKEVGELSSRIKKGTVHSLLYIENFDKYTVPTEENMNFISKFKGYLCSCAEKHNTTVLVFENNPKKLDENIIGGHRFEKKIDVSDIKQEITSVFCPKYDGYTFFYDDTKDSYVDLYLGDSGKNPELLWADTLSREKVQIILKHLDEIKSQEKFKHVKYLQIPQVYPNEYYDNRFYTLPYRQTYDHRKILECEI